MLMQRTKCHDISHCHDTTYDMIYDKFKKKPHLYDKITLFSV